MANFKISTGSYKIADKWVASGVLWINEGAIDKQIKLGPSEPKFDSEEDANQYVYVLAKKKLPRNQIDADFDNVIKFIENKKKKK